MTAIELQALRRHLFYSIPEAAQWLTASPDKPEGFGVRYWRKLEDAEKRVPEYVADNIDKALTWRERAIRRMEVSPARAANWYVTAAAFRRGEKAEEMYWRPHCSAAAHVVAVSVFDIVVVTK